MEAFTLLKYWRGGDGPPLHPLSPGASTTILAPLNPNALETHDDDEGSFFDLEFTMPHEEARGSRDGNENPNADVEFECGEVERELYLTFYPSSNDPTHLSPSHDLFPFNSSEPNSKPHFSASLLKSASKFRVFMPRLKKSKLIALDKDSNGSASASASASDSVAPRQPQCQQRKHFTVKFKVENVPVMPLFSSRRVKGNKSQKHNTEALDERRFSKEGVHKYLKMVRPLYIRVSRKYGDKLRFSEGSSETIGTNSKTQKQGNLPAGLRVVGKHLGKSRSAAAPPGLISSRRRDDSLLQQQDGIQGAILHCKRSFNASRECESSRVSSSVSDPLQDISIELSRKSMDEDQKKRLF